MKEDLLHEDLVRLISYDPDTGFFTRLRPSGSRGKPGPIRPCLSPLGYVQIGVLGWKLQGHRLAWFYMKKEWPTLTIDHIDRDRANNKWSNLREVPQALQVQNRSEWAKKKSGLPVGVYLTRNNTFNAKIGFEKKCVDLGTYKTLEDAVAAYKTAKSIYHELEAA